MRSAFRAAVAAFVVTILPMNPAFPASGNPVPGRWQKVVAADPGSKIIVYTMDGAKRECRYQSIVDESMTSVGKDDFRLAGSRIWVGYADESDGGVFVSLINDGFLICSGMDGNRFQIKLDIINEIVLLKTGKYAKEGVIWGAVGGAIGGALFSVITFNDFTPLDHAMSAGAGAGLGALGGSIAGAAVGSFGETIYISPRAALKKANK